MSASRICPMSLRRIVTDEFFPKDRQGQLMILFVVLCALSYWIISFLLYPDSPLSILALYRGSDDCHYYPLVKALSDLTFGESVVYEYEGSGVRSFSFIPLFPHAVLFRFFGAACFIIADVFFVCLHYLAAAILLRAIGFQHKICRLVSLCLTLGVLNCSFVIRLPASLSMLSAQIGFSFWDWRFPRPLISGPILLLILLLIVNIFNSTNAFEKKIVWVIFGLASAVLFQADLYSSMALCMCAAIVFVLMFYFNKSLRRNITGVILCVLAGVLVSTPFIIQRIYEHPDISRRLGLFAVERTAFFFQPQGLMLALSVFVMALFLEVLKRCLPDAVSSAHIRVSRLLTFLCLSSCFTLPISVFLLGKTIQPYHFRMVSNTISSYAVLIHLLIYFETVAPVLRPFHSQAFRKRLWTMLHISIIALCLIVNTRAAWRTAQLKSHIRADIPAWKKLPDYRMHFTEMVMELKKKKYDSCTVAGMFDGQVMRWWCTWGGGKCILADPFLSTLPDDEIESRLIYFCQLLGMDQSEFSEFITQYYVNVFWIGHNKYQASNVYRFSNLDDYSPEDVKEILSTPGVQYLEETWSVFLPVSEQKRLAIRFEQEKRSDNPRLDLIILTRNEIEAGYFPVTKDFIVVFENPVFQIWINKRIQNKLNVKQAI